MFEFHQWGKENHFTETVTHFSRKSLDRTTIRCHLTQAIQVIISLILKSPNSSNPHAGAHRAPGSTGTNLGHPKISCPSWMPSGWVCVLPAPLEGLPVLMNSSCTLRIFHSAPLQAWAQLLWIISSFLTAWPPRISCSRGAAVLTMVILAFSWQPTTGAFQLQLGREKLLC